MSGIHIDRALAATLAEADRIRALTATIPGAVRQMQREFDQRRDLYRQVEKINEIFESAAFRQLKQDLEQRREIFRQVSLNSAEGILAMRENLDAVSEVLYRNREIIDPLTFATFSGGGASPPAFRSLRGANRKLATSYRKISERLNSEEDATLPESLRVLPTTEAFSSAEVIEELDLRTGFELDEEEQEERDERREIRRALGEEARAQLGPSLAEVDPVFSQIWKGALMALASDNPERIRHFSASCRVLIEHLLDHFAPEHELVSWSPTEVKYVNGKPMRKDQLLYICRSLPRAADLIDFADSDISEVLAMFYSYNRGIHKLEPGFTTEEIDALETRTAGNLTFLLNFRKLPN